MSRGDSSIEQQLTEDQELFERMAGGVEDEEAEVITEAPAEEDVVVEESEDEVEVEEDNPMNEQPADEDEVDDDDEDEEVPPNVEPQKLYTPEEIREILTDGDFSKIDTSRLSEEGRLVMKSMQSGLTPKLQEAAELRRKLEEMDAKLEKAIPKPAPKDIYEAFDQDPDGVMKFVENKIDEAIESQDQVALEKLRETRNRLQNYKQEKAADFDLPASDEGAIAKTAAALLRAVPDIEQKQLTLRDFAIQEMGYSDEELAEATALTRGEAAVREIAKINRMYEKFTAPQRAAKKQKRKNPTKVETGGEGFEQPDTTNKDRINRAKKSGNPNDWFDVFYHMEE